MELKTKEVGSDFKLPNDIVTVKFIKRNKGMATNVEASHVISGGMLIGSVKKFRAPLTRNNTIANVLTKEEKEYLEKVTDLNLSVYGTFWETFQVSLYKEDARNRFDLSNPMDYIAIKLLESLKDEIALSWSDRNKKQTLQFAICRQNEEMLESKYKYDSKKEAFKLYGKIEDDRNKLLGVLKLLTNKPISKDSELTWLQHKIEEFIDTMPSQFVNVVNDKAFYTKMLVNTGVETGVIVKVGNKYKTLDGLELSNPGEIPTFDNAVNYLDNPLNQEIRTIVETKINKIK